jgi:hypothetical protein
MKGKLGQMNTTRIDDAAKCSRRHKAWSIRKATRRLTTTRLHPLSPPKVVVRPHSFEEQKSAQTVNSAGGREGPWSLVESQAGADNL